MRDDMRIGELAARFALNPKTIRYYEEIGLLPSHHHFRELAVGTARPVV